MMVIGDLLDKGVESSPCSRQGNPAELAYFVGFLKIEVNCVYVRNVEDMQA